MAQSSQLSKHLQAALATLFDAPTMLALCRAMGDQWRERQLDPVPTVPLCLVHLLHGHTACPHLPHLSGQRLTASASCQACPRLPLGVVAQWLRRAAAVCEQTTHDAGRWRGHRTCLVDGSSVSRPETPALQKALGQPSGQRPGCGFPVAPLLALFPAGTGFFLEARAAPWPTHAMAEVAALPAALRPGDVLGGDRAFGACAHLARRRPQELPAVFRLHQRHMVDGTPARPPTTPTPPVGHKGLPRSRGLRQLGGTDPLVAGIKPVRRPTHPPAWLTPEVFAALPAGRGAAAGRASGADQLH